MDMLDFDSNELYFDEPLLFEAQQYIDLAAEQYADDQAELPLLRAYFLEPEHPIVLVALYRFFYYQHRLPEALMVADRILKIFATRLNLPTDWRDINARHPGLKASGSMTLLRFYLLCLKGAGYLELRLGDHESAIARLQKVVELDSKDRLGARVLLDVANESLDRETGE